MWTEETYFTTYFSTSLLAVLSVTTIALNSFCIIVLRRSKSLSRKPSTVFIINLIVLQIIQGAIVIPLYIVKKANFNVDNIWRRRICNGFRLSYTITFFGTCLGVLLTSTDRFLAVYWITSYRLRWTRQRIMAIILTKWIYIAILCILPLTNSLKSYQDENVNLFNMDVSACTYNPSKAWSIYMLIINILVPYIIIVAEYLYVSHTVRFFETRALKNSSSLVTVAIVSQIGKVKHKKIDTGKHKKITRLAVALSLVYALLWIPSVVYYTLKHFCPNCISRYNTQYLEFSVTFVTFLNGIAVPIVYCFYQKEFRKSSRTSVKININDIEKMKTSCDVL